MTSLVPGPQVLLDAWRADNDDITVEAVAEKMHLPSSALEHFLERKIYSPDIARDLAELTGIAEENWRANEPEWVETNLRTSPIAKIPEC